MIDKNLKIICIIAIILSSAGNKEDNEIVLTLELPSIKEKENVTHAVAVAANKNSKYSEEAKNFLQFMSSDFVNSIITKAGVALPTNVKFSNIYKTNFQYIDVNPFVNAVVYAMPYPYSYNTSAWDNVLRKNINAILSDTISPKDELADITNKMNKFLAEENQ